MKLKESDIRKIVNESIKKTLNERNYMNNSGTQDMFTNMTKAQRHIKAAMNCFRKVGQYDRLRGNSSSSYATIMDSLAKANGLLERYYWETSEGDEHGFYDDKTPEDFKVVQGRKNYQH